MFTLLSVSALFWHVNGLAVELKDEKHDSQDLTQMAARDRVKVDEAQSCDKIIQATLAEQRLMQMLIYIVLVSLVTLTLFLWLFYLCCYQRQFKLRLDWQPKDNITVDFSKPIPVLEIGSVVIINEGKPGWFGRLLRNQKYLDQQVHLQVNCDRAQAGELKLAPTDDPLIGFQIAGEHEKPVDNLAYTVSKETPISLYLAAEQIQDINPTKEVNQALSMTLGEKDGLLPLTIKMTWEARGKIEQSILFQVLFKPELGEETPPYIEYLSHANKPFYYEKGEQITVGEYIFHSKVQHQFAKPFKESFSLKTFKDDLPLVTTKKEAGIHLAIDGQVVVPARQSVVVPVKVACDGSVIVNPGAEGQVYEFVLKGQCTIDSQPGPHRFTLQRNPKQADVRLKIKRGNIEYALFWEEVGDGYSYYPSYHTIRGEGYKKPRTQQLPEKVLFLEPPAQAFKFGDITDRPRGIYQIQLENLGKSGQGYVEAYVTAEFMVKSGEQSIIYKSGYSSADLLLLTTGPLELEEELDKHSLTVKVEEGEPAKTIHVKLNPSQAIEHIEGALLGIDENNQINENLVISAEITVAVVVDKEIPSQKREHQLTVCVPVALEEKPKPHWLAIDFGTSAIAVATGKAAKTALLCLQNPDDNNKNYSLAHIDPDNLESGGDFLPSYMACDADLRQEKQDDDVEKGHPWYTPASLRPGDPDFLSVPATSPRLRDEPERIIFSLKNWLVQPTNVIKLPIAIKAQLNWEQAITIDELPLKETLLSGYAGLASAYIKKTMGFEPGGGIVLTHPNTFTAYHQKKMREIAFAALSQPLGVPLESRIDLLSESDAVAFYFCQQRIRKGLLLKRQSERMLIYDMGAGTLDLSLIQIEWHEEGQRPRQWQVENRLGVPIAGNYLDSILARLIDDCLKNQLCNAEGEPILVRPVELEYKYPIVANRLVPDESGDTREHHLAIINLWRRIREIKHHWQGEHLKIEISQVEQSFGLIPLLERDTRLFEQPPADITVPYLELEGDKLYLNIPADFLFNYPHLFAYTEFVTTQVIEQLIYQTRDATDAAIEKSQVDTVVVAGRGAFWSGLYEKVWANFPHISDDKCHRPSLLETQVAKSAVVLGAIEWQELTRQVRPLPPKTEPRLAIRRRGQKLVYQEDWGTKEAPNPIDLGAITRFELVEVSAVLEGSEFNQYFQTVLMILSRDDYWKKDPTLYVYKVDTGKDLPLKIVMKNSDGEGEEFPTMDSISRVDSIPPWPIGSILLEPLEEQNNN